MRPIKFRAWDIRNKCYWKWELKKFSNRGITNSHYVFVNGDTWSEVGEILDDPNYIIEQFTGLLDKNGKEIWEGDIIGIKTHNSYVKRIIAWIDIDASFNIPANIPSAGNPWEIIGNIYQNPELLKEV